MSRTGVLLIVALFVSPVLLLALSAASRGANPQGRALLASVPIGVGFWLNDRAASARLSRVELVTTRAVLAAIIMITVLVIMMQPHVTPVVNSSIRRDRVNLRAQRRARGTLQHGSVGPKNVQRMTTRAPDFATRPIGSSSRPKTTM